MFPYDERAAVLEQCRVASKAAGLTLDTAVELWNYFVDRTRENLHIVLCFSPIGDAFRERLRQFPSLVNCCTIDWWVTRTSPGGQSSTHALDCLLFVCRVDTQISPTVPVPCCYASQRVSDTLAVLVVDILRLIS